MCTIFAWQRENVKRGRTCSSSVSHQPSNGGVSWRLENASSYQGGSWIGRENKKFVHNVNPHAGVHDLFEFHNYLKVTAKIWP